MSEGKDGEGDAYHLPKLCSLQARKQKLINIKHKILSAPMAKKRKNSDLELNTEIPSTSPKIVKSSSTNSSNNSIEDRYLNSCLSKEYFYSEETLALAGPVQVTSCTIIKRPEMIVETGNENSSYLDQLYSNLDTNLRDSGPSFHMSSEPQDYEINCSKTSIIQLPKELCDETIESESSRRHSPSVLCELDNLRNSCDTTKALSSNESVTCKEKISHHLEEQSLIVRTSHITIEHEKEDIIISAHVSSFDVEEKSRNLELAKTVCTSPLSENLNHEILDTHEIGKENNARKTRKCRAVSKFTQSCMDFVLEDEKILFNDFSSGSSDVWSEKDESDSSVETAKKVKKQKKIKKTNKVKSREKQEELVPQKKKRPQNKRKINKELKNRGLPYETISGKQKEARKLQDNPCKEGKCIRKCYEVQDERRQSIFNHFWSLSDERKRDWIVRCFRTRSVKRKKTKSMFSRRSLSYEYYINEGEDQRQVCQQFIMKTLDISQTYLLYTIGNANEGIPSQDRRKRTFPDKYDENTKLFAKKYIESLPALPSHYSRKNSTKLFLAQEFRNVTNLYRMYLKRCEENSENHLSEKLFINLFKEYNFSFHVPKKDKCSLCTKYENNPNEMSAEEMLAHKIEKEATYKRFRVHQNLKQSPVIVTASFDLQKVLGTPHGDSMMLFYTRKYAVYNFTVYESKTQKGYCYTWGEADGKRGSCEIATCLLRYLKEIDSRGVNTLLLYCDNCTGQNKNKVILSLIKCFLETSKNLQVIQMNYLLAGHTYMPVDSMHAVIEREIKKLIVWGPSQWPSFMQSARKRPGPYEVTVLEHQDFIDFKAVAENLFTAATIKDLRFKDIRVCTFKKSDLKKMEVKYTMMEDGSTHEIQLSKETLVKGKGKGVGKRSVKSKGKAKETVKNQTESASTEQDYFDSLPLLYKERLPISVAKFNDLKKLCDKGIIPKTYHKDYLSIPYENKVKDTLNETDEEDCSGE